MSAGVGNAVEDRVVIEELLESANIHAQANDEQQKCSRDGEPAQGQLSETVAAPAERARAARNKQKHNGQHAGDHAERQQPAQDELPCRQSEQIEVERPCKDRVGHGLSAARRIPPERQRLPLRGHRAAGEDAR